MAITIKNLREAVRDCNNDLINAGLLIFMIEGGRNGYQAVDRYTVKESGKIKGAWFIGGGTSREVITYCYSEKNYLLRLEARKKVTRLQALTMLIINGVDFEADFYTQTPSTAIILHQWAKLSGYRKPRNANGSLSRYFFHHLVKLFDKTDLTSVLSHAKHINKY